MVKGRNHGLNITVIVEPHGEGIITGYTVVNRGKKMDIKAYEDFLQIVDSIAEGEISFRYEVERERGYQVVKSAINEAKELGSFGERRIALENLLDILSEVGLFLSIEQINIADRAFGIPKNMNEEILIDYYKKNLVKN